MLGMVMINDDNLKNINRTMIAGGANNSLKMGVSCHQETGSGQCGTRMRLSFGPLGISRGYILFEEISRGGNTLDMEETEQRMRSMKNLKNITSAKRKY